MIPLDNPDIQKLTFEAFQYWVKGREKETDKTAGYGLGCDMSRRLLVPEYASIAKIVLKGVI